MLFNSHFFIFVFVPATLAIYFALGHLSRIWALRWIIAASLIFYAWWRPENVLIIVPAMLVNFSMARLIQRGQRLDQSMLSKAALVSGIVFDVLFLGYFKYTNFVLTAANDLFSSNFVLQQIVLPLGISFITFQMIAFLIDVYGKRIDSFRFQDFSSFILFFPQLIAGPIVHYREMMPQFHSATGKWNREDLSVGLTLFFFGLFKKVVIADGMAATVSSVYLSADAGAAISLVPAWLAAIGFTFQIYFDFSGYTDMALGAARLFGIRLPVNFDSPLKASSIIDFWLRWHVTLTRFLTAYVYNPIALSVTRRRLSAGLGGIAGRNTSPGAFLQLLMLPTLLTMFISGIWHGAGYPFVVWGMMHGAYLTINHAWRLIAQKFNMHGDTYDRIMPVLGWLLTFFSVVVSMVYFRSTSIATAQNILAGMMGFHGIELPNSIYDRLLAFPFLVEGLGILPGLANASELSVLIIWIVALFPVVVLLPNTLEILARFGSAVNFDRPYSQKVFGIDLGWRQSAIWTLLVSAVAFIAVSKVSGYTEFLYWQF